MTLAQPIASWHGARRHEQDAEDARDEADRAREDATRARGAVERALDHRLHIMQITSRDELPKARRYRDTVLWAEDGRVRELRITDTPE